MKTVTLSQFRKDAENILRRVELGERLILSRRGRPAIRLEPMGTVENSDVENDPFISVGKRGIPSAKEKTKHSEIDKILYRRR